MKLHHLLLTSLVFIFLFSCKKKEKARVTTVEVVNITDNSAVVKGEITDDGNSKIKNSGVAWSLNPIPTKDDNFVLDDEDNSISVQLSNLTPGTTYYVRAFVENKTDISYGTDLNFTTTYSIVSNPGQGVTDIDGNNYSTIILGNNQEWMAENLRTSTCSDGTPIPNITDVSQWSNTITPAWAFYDNDQQNEVPHGKLYNWYAVKDCAVCPDGWRVPTNEDWNKLVVYLDPISAVEGGNDAGDKLKVTGNQYWNGANENATDIIGFSAHPSGKISGGFLGLTFSGIWWTQTEATGNFTYVKENTWSNSRLNGVTQSKKDGVSIRCLKN
ncbi:hypothetical protein ERX46_04065 [Brumimicrobium glaciale]|uniref:Fibronectin type-III domain-containing protein n=1 Tax=Brumimicrobium glaciale TaxID=200475 RepID=A0A4Q4KP07_9FLAO|nr:FISUMP domain-containing protein [Brumimicrobium glaciale]RYM34557.1 hypothetical protein ERX46_04065 [Brumimicrobium glaciale]